MTDETTKQDPWWKEHTGLLIGLGLPTLVAVRLMGVSRGNVQTAWAILRELGTGSVFVALVLQTLLLGLPLLVGLGVALTWLAHTPLAESDVAEQRKGTAKWVVLVVVAIGYEFSTSAIVAIATAVAIVVLGAISLVVGRNDAKAAVRGWTFSGTKLARAALLGAGVVVLIIAAIPILAGPIWLPYEAITARGEDPITAFVLNDEGDDLVLLDASTRLVRTIDVGQADAIEDRHICQPALNLSTLVNQLEDRPEYPPCP